MANEPMFNPGLPAYETPVVEEAAVTEEPVAEVNAPVETPVVIEPAPQPEPTPAPAPQTVEVIKEVEKIVEKYPEMDEYTGQIFQALLDGKESDLLAYLSEKHKNYATMSDYDVVKANLLKSNPNYTAEDADLKIEMQYGDMAKYDLNKIDQELEPEQYERAVAHNKAVERNEKLLKLDAIEARAALEASKKDIKLPKITAPAAEQPASTPTAEQIEQGRRDWEAMVDTEIPKLQSVGYKVGDEDIAYQLTDAERKSEQEFFKTLDFNKLVTRLGWIDAEGKQNVAKMAGDVLKLERGEQIAKTAYEQGKVAGTKSTVAEIKNLDLNQNSTQSVAAQPIDIGLAAFGHLNN